MIESEDFDVGGEGIAYNDANTNNNGGQYRAGEAVDIENSSEGGYNVGWTETGEWLEYTIDVQSAGDYLIDTRYAANSGGAINISFSSNNETTGSLPLSGTGGWQIYQSELVTVTLAGGKQVMRIDILDGGVNLHKMTLTSLANEPVAGVTLSSSSTLINGIGNTAQLIETILPANATDKSVSWSSANPSVASVNSSGLVSATGVGNTTVTVTTTDGGFTAQSTINVQVLGSVSVSFDNSNTKVNWGAGRLDRAALAIGWSIIHLGPGQNADINVSFNNNSIATEQHGFFAMRKVRHRIMD